MSQDGGQVGVRRVRADSKGPVARFLLFAVSLVLAGSASVGIVNSPASASMASQVTVIGSSPEYAIGVEGTDGALWVQAPQLGPGWHSLGGQIIAAPAVAAMPLSAPGDLTTPLFVATGTDHQLWIRTLTSGWQPLASTYTYCLNNPAAAAWLGNGVVQGPQLVVACEGGNGALYVASAFLNGINLPTVTAWTDLGGALSAGPALLPNGTYFATTAGGQIWTRTYAPTASGIVDSGWIATGYYCVGAPAAGDADAGAAEWFGCHGTDGALWTATYDGGWPSASSEGGVLIDGPGLALASPTPVFVAEGGDQAVWVRTPTAGWSSLGGRVLNGVGAVGLN